MLELVELRKRYRPGGPFVLDGINLSVRAGEFVAILGRSGAGKSTLVRCVNRLIEPTSGQVRWEGEDVVAYSPRELRNHRRRVAMIFQSFNLIERLNVLQNVLVGRFGYHRLTTILAGRWSQADIALAEEALAKVGLSEQTYQRVSTLSGGQRQRVAIARALVQQPSLMLGDEPVSSLDPVTARNVMALLARINESDGITMLINLHSVDLAQQFASRIVGLADGRIVFDGPPCALDEAALERIYLDADPREGIAS